MARTLQFVLGALLVAGIVAATRAPSEERAASLSTAAPALTVTLARPRAVEWPETVVAAGAIEAWQEASIGAQVGGQRIAEVLADVGDVVTKGQVLARLDTDLLRAELGELQAALEQAEASLREAVSNRQRAERLRGQGALSEQEIQQFVTRAEVAEAQVSAARARIESQRLRLRYTDIVAPDDGAIIARTATLGAVAQVGDELFRMIRQGRLEWRGELTAEQVAKVQLGSSVELALPDGRGATAKVRTISPAMTNGSRLALVYADLEPGSSARAGMYAEGTILLPTTPALVVPAGTIVIRDGRSIVFEVQERDGDMARVVARIAKVGRRRGAEVEILGGVDRDDVLVEQGAGFLNDGDVVRIVADAGAPSG